MGMEKVIENFNTEFENILKVVLPYIVLVDNKSAIFCRKHGKAWF